MRLFCAVLFAAALVLFGCAGGGAAKGGGEKAGGDLVTSGKSSFVQGGVNITWLGHASFMLEYRGKVIYVDPYVLPKSPKPADAILYTHGHYDHCVPAKEVRKEGTVTIGRGCANAGRDVSAGESVSLGGEFAVEAVEAYNARKMFHPKGSGVGYVITLGKTRVYHAGDTDFVPEMRGVRADVALLPIGGTYTMDAVEAVEAALAIKPKIVVPMHYDYIEGTEADAAAFKKALEEKSNGTIRVVVLG